MPRVALFEAHHRRYEDWFARHEPAYQSELLAVRALRPWQGCGLEIGVGSGRFAGPLGVRVGVDPSPAMLRYASARGILAVQGVAETLPFRDAAFDYALIVTTLCFVDDVRAMLAEARRVLSPGGQLTIGFIDHSSALGQVYLADQPSHVFYREATLYSAAEVDVLLRDAEFSDFLWIQTITVPLDQMREVEPLRAGTGTGAFVVVRAVRPSLTADKGTHKYDFSTVSGFHPMDGFAQRQLYVTTARGRGDIMAMQTRYAFGTKVALRCGFW